MTDVMHVTPQGDPIPAPTLCQSRHPARGYPCEWSQGHAGDHMHLVLREVRGGRKKFPFQFQWRD